MPSVDFPKACFRSVAKKIPNTALLHATKDVEGVGSGTIVYTIVYIYIYTELFLIRAPGVTFSERGALIRTHFNFLI